MTTIRILIADDHPVVRSGLRSMLASQPDFEVIGEAANGLEVLALTNLRPAVVLMDLRMPGLDGVATTRKLLQQDPAIRVLVLTTYDTDSDIFRAIDAGVTGYLLKDAPPEELFHAIRAIARGESVLAPRVTTNLMQRLKTPFGDDLSARELEVLRQVAQGASNKEIGRSLHISEATVKTHLIHIFSKLSVNDRTAAVRVALERNLISLGAHVNVRIKDTSMVGEGIAPSAANPEPCVNVSIHTAPQCMVTCD
ncbi:MAG: response regulator transcription factor [Ktedonobacteraceae bacterium]|nr:response regulator transcription factor [Ktedonobacteraceae bacterium]